MNFVGLGILIVFTMFGAPFIYRYFIAEIIKRGGKYYGDGSDSSSGVEIGGKATRLNTANILTSFLILVSGTIILLYGIVFTQTPNDVIFGLFFITGFLIAASSIYLEMMTTSAKEYYTKYLGMTDQNEFSTDMVSRKTDWIFNSIKGHKFLLIIFYIIEFLAIIPYITTGGLNLGYLLIAIWFPIYFITLYDSYSKTDSK
jgi:hypothetical protein